MGFTQADFEELQGRLNAGKIRFGPRIQPRPRNNVPGLPDLNKSKRPPSKEKKPPNEPGYEQFQLRLWKT